MSVYGTELASRSSRSCVSYRRQNRTKHAHQEHFQNLSGGPTTVRIARREFGAALGGAAVSATESSLRARRHGPLAWRLPQRRATTGAARDRDNRTSCDNVFNSVTRA